MDESTTVAEHIAETELREPRRRERSQSPLQRAESYELALEGSTSKPPIEPGEPHGILKKSQTYEVTAESLPDGDSEATDKKG